MKTKLTPNTVLSSYRKQHGLSLRKMAAKCGIPWPTLSGIETGRYAPNEEARLKLMAATGLSEALLFPPSFRRSREHTECLQANLEGARGISADDASTEESIFDESLPVDEAAERDTEARALRAAVNKLTAKQRKALRLWLEGELTLNEIGKCIGTQGSESNVLRIITKQALPAIRRHPKVMRLLIDRKVA